MGPRSTLKTIVRKLPVIRPLAKRAERFEARYDALLGAALQLPAWCAESAASYEVVAAIHPEDFIFRNTMRNAATPRAGVQKYFDMGAESTNKLRAVIAELGMSEAGLRLLEFASGYGRMSRHLARKASDIELAACDIHEEAGAFCAAQLNIPFLLSKSVPEDFKSPTEFEVVFALSFFSHMPRSTWGRWLKALYDQVAPGGAVIFTTHGMVSHAGTRKRHKLSEDGFSFTATSEQKDLPGPEYGVAFSSPQFVEAEIARLPRAKLAIFREGDWFGHQDLYAVRKS